MATFGVLVKQRGQSDAPEGRPTVGRPALPRGRAVLGGLLISSSILGVFLAHRAATEPQRQQFVVARNEIAQGHRITVDDIGVAPLQLIEETERQAFVRPRDLIGQVARADIGAGELVQRSSVGRRAAASDADERRFSLEISPGHALSGNLEPGDHVDVLATNDTDPTATVVLARDVLVVDVDRPHGGLGSGESLRLTLAVTHEDIVRAIVGNSKGDRLQLMSSIGKRHAN